MPGLAFGVWGLGFRVRGSGPRFLEVMVRVFDHLGLEVRGSGWRVQVGEFSVQHSGLRDWGVGCSGGCREAHVLG